MPDAQQGYKGRVRVSDDGGTTFIDVSSTGFDLGQTREDLDQSELGSETKSHLAGQSDTSLSVSGHYRPGDAGQVKFRDGYDNNTTLAVQFLYDGVNGDQVDCFISEFSRSAGVDGLVDLSITLVPKSAVTRV